jgi:thimet oligopeptidase
VTAPPWSSAEALRGVSDAALDEARGIRDRLAAGAPNSGAVLEAFDAMSCATDAPSGWASLAFAAHPSSEVRDAAAAARQALAAFHTEVSLDPRLFGRLTEIDPAGLDAHAARLLDRRLRELRLAGVDRDEPTRERLRQLQGEMVELGQRYNRVLSDDVRALQLDGAGALAGLPEDFVRAHPPEADGKVRLTTDGPDFFPFLTYSPDARLRAELYEAYLSQGFPENREALEGLVARRTETAKLLGHSSWAAYQALDKMVGSADRIEAFLGDLDRAVRPRMEADREVVRAAKAKDQPGAELAVSDRFYYVARAREARYGFDARELRPYFPYRRVEQGVLELLQDLFGLRFVRRPDIPVWHPSVSAWDVHERGGTGQLGPLAGRFYLDMHPREGKYKHAAMYPIQTGTSRGRLPIAALLCNFPDPAAGDGSALMEHSDVVTLFHELGHLLHHLLATATPWVDLAGISVEWDFVEVPSQLLEEWASDAVVLTRFAHHHQTGEPIPAALVARMTQAEGFGRGLDVMRQLFHAAYSYHLHAGHRLTGDLEAFSDAMYRQYHPYPRPAGCRRYANFSHLVGYSSQYYTYQWSLALAKDFFLRFRAAGLSDPEVARQYRQRVLEPGSSLPAEALAESFLGRPFDLGAYRAWLEGA